jgi:hypothetical protein
VGGVGDDCFGGASLVGTWAVSLPSLRGGGGIGAFALAFDAVLSPADELSGDFDSKGSESTAYDPFNSSGLQRAYVWMERGAQRSILFAYDVLASWRACRATSVLA